MACRRGERSLFKGLDLTLAPGSVLHIAGGNGTGKTSLLRILVGLAQPDSGTVTWQGRDIARDRDAYCAALFYLGHAPALSALHTPTENLAFSCAMAGSHAAPRDIVRALATFGLDRQAALPCQALSQGQRRRVALAGLALSQERPVWVLDEPFTALDSLCVQRIAGLIDTHCAAGGRVILTSHQEMSFRAAVHTLHLEACAA
ncbi:MAG: cytochrome c biogenesis heme-transporting ATPase CcmA [Rhodocyclaceae bacterium]